MDSASAGPEPALCDERVLVLAPVGRDTPLLCQVLCRSRLAPVACSDVEELARALKEGAGAVLLTEEALAPSAMPHILSALAAQPSWSDLPLVLLADAKPLAPFNQQAIAALRAAGNLTVLERPVGELALVTAVQAALRARRRQCELRDLVAREQAARKAAEAAQQTAEDAVRIKDTFLATVSHELRNPLNAILLWTRLLGSGRVDALKMQQGLQAVERSARAQSQLVEDLLDVSRMMAGKLHLRPRDTDVAQVVAAAVGAVRPAAEAKRIQLEAAHDAWAGLVRVDPDRIQQVLWNLLSNAVKFTPPGGRVEVRLWRAGGELRVSVADTGDGISREFLPHVFERFRQADTMPQRRQGGLGLGLAISRQLVELHGGTLSVDSPGEGLGAVFTVALPVGAAVDRAAAPAAAHARVGEAAAVARPLRGLRVLLVEDDPDTRDVMAYTLGEQGAEVTAVGSAQAALEVLSAAAAGGRPNVLVSDLGMPDLDGYELLRRLRALEGERGEPALPVALVTAYARTDDHARALAAGFAAHLAKPVEPDLLAAAIKQLASGGAWAHSGPVIPE
ncbi:hybrid sensor histidine kinase/response regulator [Sorangium sp. So ce1099]|uniref:hybrid sensor histidine kinase/response regulator n=1 Tax=Sorangium sp. So ce1099 TaxID=3133331 RepID=UPI003F615644